MTPFRVHDDDDECGGEIVVSVKLELPHAYISVAVKKLNTKSGYAVYLFARVYFNS